MADAAADAIAELIAGRMVPTGTLIAAAVATGTAEQPDVPAASPLAQSAAQISAVLERIAARRLARGERPPPGARREPSGIGSEPAAGSDGRAALDHAGARVSGLRRLAMRAGAGVRAIEFDAGDAPVAPIRREWSGFDRSSVTLPETDDALSRRIADILMREARRHGVETSRGRAMSFVFRPAAKIEIDGQGLTAAEAGLGAPRGRAGGRRARLCGARAVAALEVCERRAGCGGGRHAG